MARISCSSASLRAARLGRPVSGSRVARLARIAVSSSTYAEVAAVSAPSTSRTVKGESGRSARNAVMSSMRPATACPCWARSTPSASAAWRTPAWSRRGSFAARTRSRRSPANTGGCAPKRANQVARSRAVDDERWATPIDGLSASSAVYPTLCVWPGWRISAGSGRRLDWCAISLPHRPLRSRIWLRRRSQRRRSREGEPAMHAVAARGTPRTDALACRPVDLRLSGR